MDLREIDFGVEIETVRRTRKRVVQAIQSVVGGEVVDEQGRTWKVTRRSGAADRRPGRHPPSRRNHPRRPGRKPGLRLLGRTSTPKPKEKRRRIKNTDLEGKPIRDEGEVFTGKTTL